MSVSTTKLWQGYRLMPRSLELLPRSLVSSRFPQRQCISTNTRLVVRSLAPDPVAGIHNINIEPMDKPDILTLPKEAVVVKVSHCAVHWVDCLMMAGQYQQAPPLPYTPGMEYSGTVVDVAADCKEFVVGDSVFVADPVNAGPRSYGQYQQYGGMATYTVAPQIAVRKIPENLTFGEAATLSGAYETAYHALIHCARIKEGEVALVHGATGATGLAAVQICSAMGVNIIITGGTDKKLDVVEKQCLGKGKVIGRHNYNSDSNLVKDVKSAVKAVDIVYDTVGGLELGKNSLRVLKFGGRYCIVGWTSTPFAGGGRGAGADHATANVLPTNLIMMKGAQVLGCPMAIHTNLDPSIRVPRVETIDRMVKDGLVKPYVSHEFKLSDAKDALLAKWNRKIIGGCVIDCN